MNSSHFYPCKCRHRGTVRTFNSSHSDSLHAQVVHAFKLATNKNLNVVGIHWDAHSDVTELLVITQLLFTFTSIQDYLCSQVRLAFKTEQVGLRKH